MSEDLKPSMLEMEFSMFERQIEFLREFKPDGSITLQKEDIEDILNSVSCAYTLLLDREKLTSDTSASMTRSLMRTPIKTFMNRLSKIVIKEWNENNPLPPEEL